MTTMGLIPSDAVKLRWILLSEVEAATAGPKLD
jgi:hypothetical protein